MCGWRRVRECLVSVHERYRSGAGRVRHQARRDGRAEAIGRTLRAAGLEVTVERARRGRSIDGYRAVVLGSAVYAGRWRSDAMRLLRRSELRGRDLWLFSSGPVGEDKGDNPEQFERMTRPPRVQQLAADLGAHEHVVFGGMVTELATTRNLARARC